MTAREERDEGHLDDIEVGPLTSLEVEDASGVLARGMRDNPNHVAVFGEDPTLRLARLGSFFETLNAIARWEALVARDREGTIVGVMTMSRPGRCHFTLGHEARTLSGDDANDPGSTPRIAQWLEAWRERDPKERHWHLGPLAVEADLQGKGIGSELLRVFCAQLDAGRENAYGETDKLETVRFCERFGFEVVGDRTVLGASNWFMLRRPH